MIPIRLPRFRVNTLRLTGLAALIVLQGIAAPTGNVFRRSMERVASMDPAISSSLYAARDRKSVV